MKEISKHNVFKILRSFSNKELKRFEEFIISPYFNKHVISQKLFYAVSALHPEYSEEQLKAAELKTLISPTGNNSTFRDAMSILYRQLLQFISTENFLSNKFDQSVYALKGLTDRQLHSIYTKKYKDTELELEALKDQSYGDYYFNAYNLNQSLYEEYMQLRDRNNISNGIEIQNKIFLNLSNHFILQSFRSYYDISTYNNVIDYNINDFPIGRVFNGNVFFDLMDNIKSSDNISYVFDIYRILFELKINKNDNAYTEYKKLLDKNKDRISNDELLFHCLELMDYCIKKDQSSFVDLFYTKELFSIYTFILKRKLYKYISKSGLLDPVLFLNILINAVKLKKVSWLESFTKDYISEVPEPYRDNLNNISYSLLYNSIKEYERSQIYAEKINEKTKIALKIRRVIIIRNFIEINKFEEALNEIINFRALIKRSLMLSELEKQKLYTFLKISENIILHEIGYSGIGKAQILRAINKFEHSWFYKGWLLKKASEMK